jgi:hypothetical protein
MAGYAVARGLTDAVIHGYLTFAAATHADEPDVRRLLRENPTGGRYEITLEREPNAYATEFGLARSHVFIIARDRRTGHAIGLCERVVRDGYVDGIVRQLPYIGALRVAASHRHRIAVLRGGFEALSVIADRPGELPFAITAVASDNNAARRLLTASVAGLPDYSPVEEFSTFALRPVHRRTAKTILPARDADLGEAAAFLRQTNARFQFSQVWTEASLRGLRKFGFLPEHVLLARHQGRICGCISVWDQRAVRQVVVQRYPTGVEHLRPLINIASPFTGLPKFPAPGTPINQAMLSHMAVDDDDPDIFLALVSAALGQAKRRGFDAAMIGFATSRNLRKVLLRHHRTIEYRTTLYLAHWQAAAAQVASLQKTIAHPEIALL